LHNEPEHVEGQTSVFRNNMRF